jgi:hypothetical protein
MVGGCNICFPEDATVLQYRFETLLLQCGPNHVIFRLSEYTGRESCLVFEGLHHQIRPVFWSGSCRPVWSFMSPMSQVTEDLFCIL